MKRKIYLICYAILQVIVSVYTMFNANGIAKEQVELFQEMLVDMPKEVQTLMSELYSVESLGLSVMITGVVCCVLGLILLWLFARDRVSVKKGLAITLTIISIIMGIDTIVTIAAIVALVVIIKTKKNHVQKQKKEMTKLRELKVTSKDLVWTILLALIYSTQFFVTNLFNSQTLIIIFDITYNVLLFALAYYVFRKRLQRDFKEFKKHFASNAVYIFKWWGIMLGLSLIAAIIRLALGGDAETANQATLNSVPLWYVAPLAIIWAPFVEECIFRGGVRRFIKNDTVFIIVSAVIFGLIHTISSETGLYNILIQSLQYVVMGGVMARVYAKTNNICLNMGVHCVQNTLGVVMMVLMSFI